MSEHEEPIEEMPEQVVEAPIPIPEDDVDTQMHAISRRSFLWAGGAILAGYGALHWLNTRSTDQELVWPLRRSLEATESVWQDIYRGDRLAPTFPNSRAGMPRVNGQYGMDDDKEFTPDDWTLNVELPEAAKPLSLTMDDIRSLRHYDQTTELKCIEGWSNVVRWGGVRFADFVKKYLKDDPPPYVYMETPSGGYFVGLDIASAVHPQTLLCYEMDGKPLSLEHGAPLRLVIPTKYGIKNIKRIGLIRFTDERPPDFWGKQGYDWYSGH